MNSDIKKIIFLIVAVILLVLLSIVLLLYKKDKNGGAGDNQLGQTVLFPDSPNFESDIGQVNPPDGAAAPVTEVSATTTENAERNNVSVTSNDNSWREEMVVYTAANTEDDNFEQSNQYENTKTYVKDEYTIDDLNLDYQPPGETGYTPEPFDITPYLYNPSGTSTPTVDQASFVAELKNNGFETCGSVTVPASVLFSQTSIQKYINTLAKKPAIKCLADAVINNCKASKVKVEALSYEATVYLTKRNDGVCGYGVNTEGGDTVELCSVADDLNNNTGKSLDFSEWQKEFESDKTNTIKSLLDNVLNPTVNTQTAYSYQSRDCIVYKL